jgi:hypothetical protein
MLIDQFCQAKYVQSGDGKKPAISGVYPLSAAGVTSGDLHWTQHCSSNKALTLAECRYPRLGVDLR